MRDHDVQTIEHLWVPLPDGTRLAARAWLPVGAPPAPALLEYLPYRKRDGTRGRDDTMHPRFAARGHPSFRVDVRGTGESDGVLLDEYHPQEIEDGLALLAWIAGHPACDGRVVLLGKSWGGINSLMIAAREPTELAGVISVCATDDRYANDAHYQGGRLLAENLIWGVGLMAVAAHPPDPRLVGPGWRAAWLRRLEAIRPFPAHWMEHASDDAYWREGRAREAAGRIRCPVLLVGGAEDPYRDAIPRLLSTLGGPVEAIVGPWAHLYPHLGRPGPALDFPALVLSWLDRRLGGRGATASHPALLAYRTEGKRDDEAADRLGRWIAIPAWPPPTSRRVLGLDDGALVDGVSRAGALLVDVPPETGIDAGGWCRFGHPDEGPYDQGEDDLRSTVFDTRPLEEPLDVLGRPVFRAALAPEGGQGLLAVRLAEVFPDGRSERVAYGLLDLGSAAGPVEVPLEFTAHRVRRGSRLRLALANACWPIAWPMPGDGPVHLERGGCSLELPVIEPSALAPLPPGFPEAPPTGLPPEPDLEGFQRTVWVEPAAAAVTVRATSDLDAGGRVLTSRIDEIDLEHGHGVEEIFTIRAGDGAETEAVGRVTHALVLDLPGLRLQATATGHLQTAGPRLLFEAELVARENGRVVFERRW